MTSRHQRVRHYAIPETVTVCPKCGAHSTSAAKVRRHYEDWHRAVAGIYWPYQGPRDLDEGRDPVQIARNIATLSSLVRRKTLKRHQRAMRGRFKAAGFTRRRVAEMMADLQPHDEPDAPDTDPECARCHKARGGYHFHNWDNCPLNPEND